MVVTLDNIVKLTVMLLSVVLGSSMVTVMVLHFHAWRRRESHDKGLRPLHVALVTFSYAIYVFGIGLGAYERLFGIDELLTYETRQYGYVVAMVAGFIALWIVGHLQYRYTDTGQVEDMENGKSTVRRHGSDRHSSTRDDDRVSTDERNRHSRNG